MVNTWPPFIPPTSSQDTTLPSSFWTAFSHFRTFCCCVCLQSSSPVQFSPIAQSCPTLYDPMNRSTPGLPVHHQPLSKVGSSFSVLNKNGSSSNFPWQIYQLPSPPNISLVSLIGTFHNLLLAPGKGFSGVAVATESVLPLGLFTSSHNIFWPLYLIY